MEHVTQRDRPADNAALAFGGEFECLDDMLAHNEHLVQEWNNWLAGKGVNVSEAELDSSDPWAVDLDLAWGDDGEKHDPVGDD